MSQSEIWAIGQAVADKRGTRLLGRGDLQASVARGQRLQVAAAPIEGNANHANIAGWPADKPAQKMIAQEIAASAHFIEKLLDKSD